MFFAGEDCKNKWKSIRSAYIRALNTKSKSGSAAGSKKDYYLSPYLQFLNPFTKNRPQEGNIIHVQENETRMDFEHESQVEENFNCVPYFISPEQVQETPATNSYYIPIPSPQSPNISIRPEVSKSRKRMSEVDKLMYN